MNKFSGLVNVAKVFLITGKYLLLSKKPGSDVVMLKNDWSREILEHFKIDLEIKGNARELDASCILLGNHISYLDIPVLIRCCPDITFVSKKEVKYWPVIGNAAVKMQTIFVERGSSHSRAKAKEQITNSLLNKTQRLAIFPSGTTSIKASERWQKGVFEIAEKNNIKIQPFKLSYEPLREAAYIDDDNLLVHMYDLLKHKKIKVILELHEPVDVGVNDCDLWKSWCESSSLGLS
ncbi:MAG: 1-acyl-sn-glycerol-3-phosphate acyltransferase [Bacteriovorax sp.]|nr:1-acyl-sn-glycerol-3-phosphate acyltransferase [Bacteriovorax sp.]